MFEAVVIVSLFQSKTIFYLLFLVCLQIHNQFPMSFEFNEYFLKFLAYHHVSNRFRTFMLDNEQRRVDAGWMLEETKMAARSEPSLVDSDNSHTAGSVTGGISIWDYIDDHRKQSPTFFNFLFTTRDQEPVSNESSLFRTIFSVKNFEHFDWLLLL